jgi:hypothetical protein
MTEEKIVDESVSICETTSRGSCQTTSCGDDDYSNSNPMKMVIA